MSDLRTQLKEYLDETAPPVAFEEITRRIGTTPLSVRIRIAPRIPGWVYAIAAAAVVLLLIGGLALLIRPTVVDPAEELPTPTTVPSTPTTVRGAAPEGFGGLQVIEEFGSSELPPSFSASDVDLPIVSQSSTVSPIGEIQWTVFELSSAEQPAFLDGWTEIPDATVDASHISQFIASDGILIEARQKVLGIIGEMSLQEWDVGVAWPETISLESQRQEWADDGLTLFVEPAERGVVELVLYTMDEDEGQDSRVEVVARLELSIARNDGTWVVEVVDSETGSLIGTITSSIPWPTDRDILDSLTGRNSDLMVHTLSTGTSAEVVEPDWFDPLSPQRLEGLTLEEVIVRDEAFLAYVHGESSDSEPVIEVWRSTDGRSWDVAGLIDLPPVGLLDEGDPANPLGWNGILESDGVLIADFWNHDQVYALRRSDDGINWESPQVPPIPVGNPIFGNPNGSVHPVDAGWVWMSGDATDHALWVSDDGDTWHQIELSVLASPLDAGVETGNMFRPLAWASDNRIVYRASNTLVIGEIQ